MPTYPKSSHRHIRGVSVPPEVHVPPTPVTWGNFERGYIARLNPRVTPEASDFAPDMLVDNNGALVAGPTNELVEVLDHDNVTIEALFLHANLDGTNELIVVAPPYLGIQTPAGMTWYPYALVSTGKPWVMTNYAGQLLFTNGSDAVHLREAQSTLLSATVAPLGHTMFVFAGRIFVGNTYLYGQKEPLGLAWNAANGNPNDWEGIGAGFESLISDMTSGDYIVSGRPIGFDFAAILCRHSLWVARRTGLPYRPADFSPRIPGLGCVSDKTVCITRYGVTFLSDTGIYTFDGNREEHISLQVDADIFPLDEANIQKYAATYDWKRDHYCLYTPQGQGFVYEGHHQRWFLRDHTYDHVVVGTDYIPAITWDELDPALTWADVVGNWEDMGSAHGPYALMGVEGINLRRELTPALSTDYEPRWRFAEQPHGGRSGTLLTYHGVEIEYIAPNGGELKVYLPDIHGVMTAQAASIMLPATSSRRVYIAEFISTGLGAAMQIGYPNRKDIQVSQVQLLVSPASMRMTP